MHTYYELFLFKYSVPDCFQKMWWIRKNKKFSRTIVRVLKVVFKMFSTCIDLINTNYEKYILL